MSDNLVKLLENENESKLKKVLKKDVWIHVT